MREWQETPLKYSGSSEQVLPHSCCQGPCASTLKKQFILKAERERQGGREQSSHPLVTPQMPAAGDQAEARTQSRCPTWVEGTQVVEPVPAASQGAH